VALLGVIAVDLLACLADLLRDDESFLPLDDTLDPRVLVSFEQDESIPLLDDPLVLASTQLHLLDARPAAALAVKRNRRLDTVKLRTFLDPLVHTAEDLLVACRAIGELHSTICAQFDPDVNVGCARSPARERREKEGGRERPLSWGRVSR
jgi:hypothetical protein